MKSLWFSTGGVHLATMVGMLSELQTRLDDPDAIGGISAGAMIAAVCATYGINEGIEVMTQHMGDKLLKNRHKFFNTILSLLFNESLVDSNNLLQVADNILTGRKLLSDLYIAYTDKDTMEYVSKKFEKGKTYKDLYKHVVASMSIPLVLPPTKIKNHSYVDGGLYHSLPVEGIQRVVGEASAKKEPLDLVVLMTKPWDYHLKKDSTNVKIFKIIKQGLHFMSGYQCIRVHNDEFVLKQILNSAKVSGEHVNYSLFHLKQEDTDYWDKKIPFQKYAAIQHKEIQDLIQLGKDIITESLKTDLKF